jgi:hypothetical protein
MTDKVLNNTIMTLKASSLQGPKPTKGKLSTLVVVHIRHIERLITEADADNKTFVAYNIESDFEDVPGMPNSEVQVFVYSKIIEDLTTCEYDVYFRNIPDQYTFFIRWGSPMANLEIENRKKILSIASYKYKNKKKDIHKKKSQKLHDRKHADDTIKGLSKRISQAGSRQGQVLKKPFLQQQQDRGGMNSHGPANSHFAHKELQEILNNDSDDPEGIADDEDEDGEDWTTYLDSS